MPHRAPSLLASMAGLAMALSMAGCDLIEPDDRVEAARELARAHALWTDAGVEGYQLSLFRTCFCPREYQGPVSLTVVGDSVTAAVYEATGEPVPADRMPVFPTVAGLFEVLAEALASRAERVEVTYDATLGYPRDLFIDVELSIADEEFGFTATLSRALPHGSSAPIFRGSAG
jgi:Family of unknown function (DUF6174)